MIFKNNLFTGVDNMHGNVSSLTYKHFLLSFLVYIHSLNPQSLNP